MVGQQFLTGGTLLDMRGLDRARAFDEEHGLLEVEPGVQWPDVMRAYLARSAGLHSPWALGRSTGADRPTIGAVAANICCPLPRIF